MAISNNTYLDYDGLKVYTQALLGKFALSSKTPELDSNGIIKNQYLPSYVDDVVEYANRAAFPSVGDKSKLYLAQDTGDIYRWTGTQYVNMLSADGIAAQAAKVTNALTFGSKTYDGSLAQTITKADLGLGNVENVALSTWKGSTNITTLGVITTGTWQGTKIANEYLANSSITIGTTKFNLGDAKTAIEGLTSLLFSGASGALTYNKTDKYYSLADNLVVNGILASGTSGTGGGDGYSQVEWADIQTMTESVSGSLASAYAVKESYLALNTIVSTKADKITLDAVTKKVISLENKYTAVTTDIANHVGNTTVHITSAERTAWNNKQAAISDLATIRSNAATAYGWGDHSKAGYITGITKAMVESVLTGNITSHTHSYLPLRGGTMANTNVVTNLNADLLDGYHKTDILRETHKPTSVISLNDVVANGIDFTSWDYATSANINNQPDGDGVSSAASVVSFGTDYPFQIYSDYNNTNKLFYRSFYSSTGWKAWRQFAFLDSNVASASKWANARTITLTGSVTGSVSIDGSDNVSLDTTTNHTHPFASITSKPTTLSGYGITDASRFFRYTIPASGNKGVRITFTSGEPVKITVSGANQGAQLVLIGTGYGEGGFVRNNFTEVVPSTNALYTWCVSEKDARSVEIFSARAVPDVVTVESPSLVTFTDISALSTDAVSRHLLTSANYSSYALPLTGGTIRGLLTITANANYGLTVNSILENSKAAGINFQINGTTYGRVLVKDTKELLYNDMTKTYTVYHSGNSNNTSTVWSAKRLATPGNLICPYTWEQRNDITGTLVLSLPYGFNSMMQCIELTVYDYSSVNDGSAGATKFFVDGYNYTAERWINPHAFRIGNKNVRVRLGYYNNKCCILIGETNTTWNYPRICVDKVYGSFSVHANDFKDKDWSCAILQDESQITDIATASDTPLYAPCYTRSGRPYVTDNDVAAKYLKLTGGTITGSIRKNGPNMTPFLIYNFSDAPSGGWARSVLECRVDDKNAFRIAPFGNYTQGATNNKIQYVSLGFAEYGGLNLRISDTSLTWGDDAIYHAGNANNISTDWTCKSLVAAGDIKTSGWCKATNGLLIEESGVYYTHHSQFGEIDIVRGNEFIWGSQTDTLYFNYRPSANKTTTVAHYVWNAGSSTTYATHTMGTLTVLGAITATTTIYAKTGIYTDGYISAKQASTSSDRRLKKDFCKIDNALKYVLKTHYTRFRWKDDNKESIGIIAQEEQNREYGFLVQNNEKIGHLTYDYAASTALLGAAIQEEDSKVEKLKKRVAELEKELSNLKRKCQH